MNTNNTDIYFIVIIGMAFSLVIAIAVVLFYVRYRQRLSRQQQKMQEAELAHQKSLLYATIQSQEEERKRIGRDLHDDVGAALSNLRMQIQRRERTETIVMSAGGNYLALIDKIMSDVRAISHNLSPPMLELFGFVEALDELCELFSSGGILQVHMQNEVADIQPYLPATGPLHIYRVFQELLANTVKHANARQVWIRMNAENSTLVIRYRDDGNGFAIADTKRTGMGMQNIESRLDLLRAGYIIDTAPGKGFLITIWLRGRENLSYLQQ